MPSDSSAHSTSVLILGVYSNSANLGSVVSFQLCDRLVQISNSLCVSHGVRGEPNIALKYTFWGSILGSNSCVTVLYRYQDTGKSTSVHVRTLPVQLYALPAGPTATPFILLVWSTILINKSMEFASYWLHPPLGVGNCKLSRPEL